MNPAASQSDQVLKDQVAVVTGAAHGIGLGIARHLLALGASVVLADLSAVRLADAVAGLETSRIGTYAADLSTEHAVTALDSYCKERFGPAQILVNCAGGGVILPFLSHTPETLKATIDRNLWTAIWCSRVFLPAMVEANYGRIINIGADSVRNGLADHAAYNAAKGGVHGMTSGLAREFARNGITVNTVAPCVVNTEALVRARERDPVTAEAFIEVVPVGRAGEVDEIASMVAYLARPEAAFVTGQVISVNGGSTML